MPRYVPPRPSTRTFRRDVSLRIPSVAAPLLFLFFFSAFVVAQISAPICNSTAVAMGMHLAVPAVHSLAFFRTKCWYFVQTSNSLGQSPCVVSVSMMATWNGVHELSFFLSFFKLSAHRDLVFSSLLQSTIFFSCSRIGYTLAHMVMTSPTCACAVPFWVFAL